MRTLNFPSTNILKVSSFNTFIIELKVIDPGSTISINDERTYQNNTSDNISTHVNPEKIIDHACDYSWSNLVNTKKKEMSNVFILKTKIMTNPLGTILSSKVHEYVSTGAQYD